LAFYGHDGYGDHFAKKMTPSILDGIERGMNS